MQSNHLDKFFGGNSRLAQNGAKRAAVNLPMVGNDGLGEWIIAPHDDVTAMLSPHGETKFLKRADEIGAGNLRKLAHTAKRRASKRSSGTGSPSSLRERT